MSPKTQEFYSKLVAFYLDDNSVIARLENSYQDYIKSEQKKWRQTFSKAIYLEGSQRDLETYFPKLLDSEISEAIKTFKIRMFPASKSQVVFKNGAVISAPTLQPYQQAIFKSLLK